MAFITEPPHSGDPYWPKDNIHGAAIICEESGELIRAALQLTYEKGDINALRDEAIQTAATCIRFIDNLKIK